MLSLFASNIATTSTHITTSDTSSINATHIAILLLLLLFFLFFLYHPTTTINAAAATPGKCAATAVGKRKRRETVPFHSHLLVAVQLSLMIDDL